MTSENDGKVTALIMAGKRSGVLDPLAERAGVAQKCVVPVGGMPMIERVVANVAASPRIGEIRVVAHEPDEIAAIPSIAKLQAEGAIGAYVHGGKIGVLVSLNGGDAELGKDVAMHVAAVNPMVISGDQVPAEVLEKEKEIIRAQPDMEGKPAEIVEKMLGGRINKYLKEVSLLDQPFVKDPNTSVGALVKGAGAEIVAFERLVVGEGIEKEEVDFAAEVQAAAKG